MTEEQQNQIKIRVHETIAGLLADRGWQLVSDLDQFVAQVVTALREKEVDLGNAETAQRLVRRQTLRQYSIMLYEATQADGTPRQRRAYEELWPYLFRIATWKAQDVVLAEECAQRALVKVWEKGGQCRDPGSFLGYCRMIVLNQVRMAFRQPKTVQVVSVGDLAESEPETDEDRQWDQIAASAAARESPLSLEETLANREALETIDEALKLVLKSDTQYATIRGLLIEGLGVKAMAERLGTRPSNVHTLKSRALARLRRDERFRHILQDLLKE